LSCTRINFAIQIHKQLSFLKTIIPHGLLVRSYQHSAPLGVARTFLIQRNIFRGIYSVPFRSVPRNSAVVGVAGRFRSFRCCGRGELIPFRGIPLPWA